MCIYNILNNCNIQLCGVILNSNFLIKMAIDNILNNSYVVYKMYCLISIYTI